MPEGVATPLTQGQIIGLLGGLAALLGGTVVTLVVYIFNRQIANLRECIDLLRQEIENLVERQNSKSSLIGQALARLDKLEAEHNLRGALCPALHKHMRSGDDCLHGHERATLR